MLALALAGCARKPAPAAPSAKPDDHKILSAFYEIAFTSEYGAKDSTVKKWTKRMNVAVHGSQTDDDGAALDSAMAGLNGVSGFPGIGIASEDVNVNIWFVKLAQMPDVLPEFVSGNWGYFSTRFDNSGISEATIAIATDVTKQDERNHLIFEEVLQSTGLMQDLYDYPDSIFYGNWTTV